MISKIIQKEKERQDKIIKEHTAFMGDCPEDSQPFQYNNPVKETHKQSLKNLKEYIKGVLEELWKIYNYYDTFGDLKNASIIFDKMKQLKEDIKELNSMIERYK
jgi:hypothetical protein